MEYYQLEPEVAGGWGGLTEADTSVHPPVVHALHYEFQGWLGDELVESFPCFLVSARVGGALRDAGLSGFFLAEAEISVSEEFRGLQGDLVLPHFLWLRVVGQAGEADFGLSKSHLIVSERALAALRRFSLSNAEVSEWKR